MPDRFCYCFGNENWFQLVIQSMRVPNALVAPHSTYKTSLHILRKSRN